MAEQDPNLIPEWYKLGNEHEHSARVYERAEQAPTNTLILMGELHKEEKPDKKVELEKKVESEYNGSVAVGEVMVNSVVDSLFRGIPPWPYNTRMEKEYFDGAQRDSAYEIAKGNIEKEAKPYLYRMMADMEQQAATVRLLFSTGGPVRGYFDVLAQMTALLAQERYHAVAADFVSAFSKEDPGLTNVVSEQEKQKLDSETREGIRPEVIKKQDEWRQWHLAIAAAGQWDFTEKQGRETFMPLSPQKLEFIRLLFGEEKSKWVHYITEDGVDHVTPKSIGTWYSTSDKENGRRQFLAKAEALLSIRFATPTGADKPSKDFTVWDYIDTQSPDQISNLAYYVNLEANKKVKQWKDPMKDVHTRISERVISSAILYDLAFFTAGKLGWHLEYKKINLKDEKLEKYKKDPKWKGRIQEEILPDGTQNHFVIKSKPESGGLYKAWDTINGVYWALRKHLYDDTWKSATTFLTGTNSEIRKLYANNKLGWAPDIEDFLKKDKNLQDIWDFWFSPNWENERRSVLGSDLKTVNMDPEVAAYLKEKMPDGKSRAWAWDTWVKEGDNVLVFPMFFPHTLDIINLWEFLRIDVDFPKLAEDNPDLAKRMQTALQSLIKEKPQEFRVWNKKTNNWEIKFDPNDPNFLNENYWKDQDRGKVEIKPFDMYRYNIKQSEIDWTKINHENLDRYWVNMSMLVKFLRVMIDPVDLEKDKDASAFFESASGSSAKELAKRIILMFRDTPKEMNKMVTTLLPYAVIQNEANKAGIIGPNGIITNFAFSDFVENSSKWIQAFKELPSAIGDDIEDFEYPDYTNFSGDMAILAAGYMMRFAYIGQAAVSMTGPHLNEQYTNVQKLFANQIGGKLQNMFMPRNSKENNLVSVQNRKFTYSKQERH